MSGVSVNNPGISYDDAGFGIPLIFIHGVTESKNAFYYQSSGLQDDYRIIAYDLRLGLKNPQEYALDLLIDDLKRFLDSVNIGSAIICGHSFGALIAMKFSMMYPDYARALVLISAYSAPPHDISDSFLMNISAAGYRQNRSLSAKLRMHITHLITGKNSDIIRMSHENATMKQLIQEAEKTNKTTVSQRMKIIRKTDLTESLIFLSMPVLVVAGSADIPFILSSAQSLYEKIPDASLEVIEKAGHFCFVTHHDLFNAALDEFLKERISQIS